MKKIIIHSFAMLIMLIAAIFMFDIHRMERFFYVLPEIPNNGSFDFIFRKVAFFVLCVPTFVIIGLKNGRALWHQQISGWHFFCGIFVGIFLYGDLFMNLPFFIILRVNITSHFLINLTLALFFLMMPLTVFLSINLTSKIFIKRA